MEIGWKGRVLGVNYMDEALKKKIQGQTAVQKILTIKRKNSLPSKITFLTDKTDGGYIIH
jgi:hypothetical protein